MDLSLSKNYKLNKNFDSRINAYKITNPMFKLLHIIPNLGADIEKRLHKKFQYENYGNEWFYYDQSIIDYVINENFELTKS